MTLLSVPHGKSKPRQWGFNPAYTDPDFRWFWNDVILATPFDEGGGTIVRSYGRHRKNGSFVSTPTWQVGRTGGLQLKFTDSGSPDKVSWASDAALDVGTNPFTIVWYGILVDGNHDGQLFSQRNNSTLISLSLAQGSYASSSGLNASRKLGFLAYEGSDQFIINSTNDIADTKPHLIIASYGRTGSSSFTVSVDGPIIPTTLVTEGTGPPSITGAASVFGGLDINTAQGFDGIQSWGALFHRVLTAGEHRQLGGHPDPFAVWRPDYSQFWGKAAAAAAAFPGDDDGFLPELGEPPPDLVTVYA